jgi:hypothetical protein
MRREPPWAMVMRGVVAMRFISTIILISATVLLAISFTPMGETLFYGALRPLGSVLFAVGLIARIFGPAIPLDRNEHQDERAQERSRLRHSQV